MSETLLLEQALQTIIDLHQPIRGEARADRNLYCSVCHGKTATYARYPCATVRIARKCLQAEEMK